MFISVRAVVCVCVWFVRAFVVSVRLLMSVCIHYIEVKCGSVNDKNFRGRPIGPARINR